MDFQYTAFANIVYETSNTGDVDAVLDKYSWVAPIR
jgi:hypothetical protein